MSATDTMMENERTLSDEVKELLIKLRENKLSVLERLEKQERKLQKVISVQSSKRQDFLIFSVIACLLILVNLLLNPESFEDIATIIFGVKLLLIAGSVLCLVLAIFRIPGVLRYKATWKNYKEQPTYGSLIDDCNQKLTILRKELAEIKEQFNLLDKELLSDEEASGNAGKKV